MRVIRESVKIEFDTAEDAAGYLLRILVTGSDRNRTLKDALKARYPSEHYDVMFTAAKAAIKYLHEHFKNKHDDEEED